jgi:chromosome segregation ATPase
MNKLIIFLLSAVVLSACSKPETTVDGEKLQAKIDSLQNALEVTNYSVGLLGQIGTYMDSIDANRKWVQLNLETGLSQDDYIARMKNINQYVQKAEWTISELEKTRSAYTAQVKRLKKQIAEKDEEIKSLQILVAQTQADKAQLEQTLTLTETELVMSQLEQDITEEELVKANTQAQALMQKVQLTRAESLYSQGENMEELASSIQFAPNRKRQALEDALKYYTESKELGYEPAAAKVEAVKAKLKK